MSANIGNIPDNSWNVFLAGRISECRYFPDNVFMLDILTRADSNRHPEHAGNDVSAYIVVI
jgi:hypothetical protein